jgi:hypothetical protein
MLVSEASAIKVAPVEIDGLWSHSWT